MHSSSIASSSRLAKRAVTASLEQLVANAPLSFLLPAFQSSSRPPPHYHQPWREHGLKTQRRIYSTSLPRFAAASSTSTTQHSRIVELDGLLLHPTTKLVSRTALREYQSTLGSSESDLGRRRGLILWLAGQSGVHAEALGVTASLSMPVALDCMLAREIGAASSALELDASLQYVERETLVTLRKLVRLADWRGARHTLRLVTRKVTLWTSTLQANETQAQLAQTARIATHVEALYAALMHVYSRQGNWAKLCSMTDQLGIFRELTGTSRRLASASQEEEVASHEAIANLRHFKLRLRSDRAFRPSSQSQAEQASARREAPWQPQPIPSPRHSIDERILIQKARNRAMHALRDASHLLSNVRSANVKPDTEFLSEFLQVLERITDVARLLPLGVAPTRCIQNALYAAPPWSAVRALKRQLTSKAWRLFETSWVAGEWLPSGVRPVRGLTALLYAELHSLEPLLPLPHSVAGTSELHKEVRQSMELLRRLVHKLRVWLDEASARPSTNEEAFDALSQQEAYHEQLDAAHVAARAAHLTLRLHLSTGRAERHVAQAQHLLSIQLPSQPPRTTLHAQHTQRQIQTAQRAGLVALFNAALAQQDAGTSLAALQLAYEAAKVGLFDAYASPGPLQVATHRGAEPLHVRAAHDEKHDPCATLARLWARAIAVLPRLETHGAPSSSSTGALKESTFMMALPTPLRLARMRAALPMPKFMPRPKLQREAMQEQAIQVLLSTLRVLEQRHACSDAKALTDTDADGEANASEKQGNWRRYLHGAIVQPGVIEPLIRDAIRFPPSLTATPSSARTLRTNEEVEVRLARVLCVLKTLRARGTTWRWVRQAAAGALRSCAVFEGHARWEATRAFLQKEEMAWAQEHASSLQMSIVRQDGMATRPIPTATTAASQPTQHAHLNVSEACIRRVHASRATRSAQQRSSSKQ